MAGPFAHRAVPVPSSSLAPASADVRMPTDPEELFELGFAHFDSVQAARRKKAYVFFDKAAELGHVKAKRFLGQCLMDGLGVERMPAEAVRVWKEAATQGDDQAKFKLAEMFFFGEEPLEQNFKMAELMFRQLADRGHVKAMENLADIYREGLGVDKDEDKADEWLQKAAELDTNTTDGHDFALMLDDLPDFADADE